MGNELLEILNVRVVGTGEKVVVLSHGFGTDQSAWNRILPYLTRDHRVVLYDLMCAGSVNPDHFDFRRYTTLDAYADDLFSILDSLSIDHCFFVGHSFSAMIGISPPSSRPHLFHKLILLGASPRFLNDTDYHGGFEREETEKVLAAMESNYEAWVRGFAPLAVGADVPAAVREFSRTLFNMSRTSLCSSRGRCSTAISVGFSARNGAVLHRAVGGDVSVPVSVAGYLKAHLGGKSTVEILKTEGHLPHLSAPALLVPVLRRALSSR